MTEDDDALAIHGRIAAPSVRLAASRLKRVTAASPVAPAEAVSIAAEELAIKTVMGLAETFGGLSWDEMRVMLTALFRYLLESECERREGYVEMLTPNPN
jgi:hypothetical protein